MQELHTAEIDGFTYEFRCVPIRQGADFAVKLARVASAAFAGGDDTSLADRLSAAADALPPGEIARLADLLAASCTVLGKGTREPMAGLVDAHFGRRYLAFAQWLREGVTFNFGPAFQDLLRGLGAAPRETP